jgi:phosphoheptose isomerase
VENSVGLKARGAAATISEGAARNLDLVASTSYPDKVQEAIDLIVERLSSGKKLLVCGNGGSAADALHICAELVGIFEASGPPCRPSH